YRGRAYRKSPQMKICDKTVVEAEHPDQRCVAVAKGLRAILAELTDPDSVTTTQNPIPRPQLGAKLLLLRLGLLMLLTALLGGSVYFFALSGPLAQARDAMRMARYDTALDALDTVPAWLRNWPAL